MLRQQIPRDVNGYQELACSLLGRVFCQDKAIKEWDVTKDIHSMRDR